MRPCTSSASAVPSSTPSGIGNVERLGHRDVLGVAAGAAQRDDALAGVGAHAGDLGAGDQRQRRSREVGVVALVGVGEVHARAGDLDQHLPGPGLRRRQLDELEHLGSAELLHLDRAHAPAGYPSAGRAAADTLALSALPTESPPPMSLTVVGSIAFDAVTTPFGSREKMLGGSAVHFSLAASFFTDVRVVGPVGDDFGDDEYAVLHARGVITDDIEHVARRQDVLLARPLRVRPQHRAHRRHAAQRLRRLRAQALGRLARLRRAVPREHPARPPARGARAVRATPASSRWTR